MPDPIDHHPKNVLYGRVYDPLTVAWFAALSASSRVTHLVETAATRGTLAILLDLNAVFHELAEDVFDHPGRWGLSAVELDEMVTIVAKYSEHVLWVDHAAPPFDAGRSQFRAMLIDKMKRNASLGAVEALICLESACRFGREQLALVGNGLEGMLRRSRDLYNSLAVLHDDQEQWRLHVLTGIDGRLAYPGTDYADVLSGRVGVRPDRFVMTGGQRQPKLRFVSVVVGPGVSSPTKRCPGHRFQTVGGARLLDVLWDLLIDVYRESGRLAPGAGSTAVPGPT